MDEDSIVDYLKSQGRDSSFQNRRAIAASYGIIGYTGSAEQNIELLSYLRAGRTGSTLSWWAWLKRIFGL
jgi:hypothetical protein